jgi:hypothetical protein
LSLPFSFAEELASFAMKTVLFAFVLCIGLSWTAAVHSQDLKTEFIDPADAARPGVYWYFMDGNQDRDAMVADLRAMKDVGIGSVVFLEVDLGIPRGPHPFMSESWQDNVANAFVEAGKLDMEVILGTGPGWAGSGGSWVDVADSMQHLVGSGIEVKGPQRINRKLPVPPPHQANRYAGMNQDHADQREAWHQNVAVLAFPTPEAGTAILDDARMKALIEILPYTGRKPKFRFVMPQAEYAEPDDSRRIDVTKVIDLTDLMSPEGELEWDVPEGNWTVMRFVARSTGQTTRPAPQAGHGFEHNKFDSASYQRHWDNYQAKLLKKVIEQGGPLQPGKGLTTIHLDSWEMSSQNWTAKFRQQFLDRRGYDPTPFFPAFMGLVVGSVEQSERFLWDMRKTSQELVLEEYAEAIKKIGREHGLLYSNEPYDMNPAGNIDLGSLADIPMCEFWYQANDAQYSCVEAVSIAHTMGQQVVKAEAFTSRSDAFAKTPANMKNQTDWAFALGINGIVFHTFQHQPLGKKAMPGMTMGRYGIQWHRNQTFWNFLPDYHQYITRCSSLLRQGESIADILYLIPEGAPHIFEAPKDAFEGEPRLLDKRGYSFDAVTPRILDMRAEVQDGRIAFPDGSKYRVLVLPDVPTMTPEFLTKVEQLIRDGATVIGNPPRKSPSLVNYPACDQAVASRANEIWGGTESPKEVERIALGQGEIFWGGELDPNSGLFPTYQATATLLAKLGLAEDFSSPSGHLRYIHRQTENFDFYFVSNRTESRVVTEGIFRIEGLQPQLWDPSSGETRAIADYESSGGLTRIPLLLEPLQSFFIVFPHDAIASSSPEIAGKNFAELETVQQIKGPWRVAFDPASGGPANVSFANLADWSKRPEKNIKYYSGVATYRKSFDSPSLNLGDDQRVYLDLGTVFDIGRVRLNGQDLGVVWTTPWRVDITSTLKPQDNELVIEVANGWSNRLIGDQQPGNKNVRKLAWPSGLLEGKPYAAGRFTFSTHGHHRVSSPLRPAGLIGPVSILVNAGRPSSAER